MNSFNNSAGTGGQNDNQKDESCKIVMVHNDGTLLEMMHILLRSWLKNAQVLSLTDSKSTWQLITRANPDLLITDDIMPGLTGEQICLRLCIRKVTYPIIVLFAWEPTAQWVRECTDGGLNIHLLPAPFANEDFRTLVEACLKTPQGNGGKTDSK